MTVYLDRDAGRETRVPHDFRDWLYNTGYFHNPEPASESYYDLHRDEHKARVRCYYFSHREKRIGQIKQWQKKNKARYNRYMRNYMRRYRKKSAT